MLYRFKSKVKNIHHFAGTSQQMNLNQEYFARFFGHVLYYVNHNFSLKHLLQNAV